MRLRGLMPIAAVLWSAANGLAQSPPPDLNTTQPGSQLAAQIHTLLADSSVSRAHWGIAVRALDGTPLFSLDADKLFRPASTAKLFTTAAAMAMLGPDHTETTSITGDFDQATGTVQGDLNLVGAGDPDFETTDIPYRHNATTPSSPHDLADFADQLVAKGVRHITGNLVGDDSLLGHEPPPEGWAAEDLLWGYGALPSALSVADNELRLTVTPETLHPPGDLDLSAGATPAQPQVQVDQLAPYLQTQLEATLSPQKAAPATGLSFTETGTDPETIRIAGTLSPAAPADAEHIAINDPARYAAMALRQLLSSRGVQIDGEARSLHAATDTSQPYLRAWRSGPVCTGAGTGQTGSCAPACGATPTAGQILATHVSAPLRDDIVFTLKTSANLHAELLVGQLGLLNACPGAAAVNGARLIRTWLLHLGVADGDFIFYDGSGLSAKDLVTPRAEAQLLAYATTQPWFAQWKAALPVGGVDGTLAARFVHSPLKGKIFAKTGTLGESRALAGYVQGASGREVLFSILVDNHEPGTSADRIAMDKIVEAIAANN